MRLIGYKRVSTTEQAESGAGLQAQHDAIVSECRRRGWELVAMADDTSTGASTDRPGLDEALAALERGLADGLIVAKLDRLTRSVADFARLVTLAKKQGWNLVALDFGLDLSTPQGELLANVLVSVSQWERRIIGVRTSEALQVKIANGEKLGRPRQLDPATRKKIRRWRRSGVSLQEIVNRLEAQGVATAHGGRWHPETIRKIAA
jgi:DNA invertase Pin-like site-specific DNA recombinase